MLAALRREQGAEAAAPAAVLRALSSGGRGWLVDVAGEPAGYALLSPVPGLPGVFQLEGALLPRFRRQGLGSALLPRLLALLPPGWRIEVPLPDQAPAGQFLTRCGFQPGHVECLLHHALPPLPPAPAWPDGAGLQRLARDPAAAAFVPLYDAAFAPHPWYQPYTVDEAAALLDHPQDLWFLHVDGRRCGFAWLRREAEGRVTVEPLGIVPTRQGQGWGRLLLQSVLAALAEEGATGVAIGAWEANRPALALYERLGFTRGERTCFWVWTAAKS